MRIPMTRAGDGGRGRAPRAFPAEDDWQDGGIPANSACCYLSTGSSTRSLRKIVVRPTAQGAAFVSSSDATLRSISNAAGMGPPVIAAPDRLLTACKEADRPRLDADEVLLHVSFLWSTDSGPDRQERAGHILAIMIDGLRAT
jgi:hypothetical protein